MRTSDPRFFEKQARQQTPSCLWIGCSDSRVPPGQILGLPPGHLFVHRNIANLVHHEDINCLAVLQYAVEVLQVKHIVVCGHYGCGGVQAAMENNTCGHVNDWLVPVRDMIRSNLRKLENLSPEDKIATLCELNVKQQVHHVCNTAVVQNAWKQRAELTVHGWIYDIRNGLIEDLNVTVSAFMSTD